LDKGVYIMRWAIINTTEVLYGPATWDARTLSIQLSLYNLSVSLPVIPPNSACVFGNISLCPVVDVEVPVGPTQKCTGETVVFADGIVTCTPVVVEKTPEELNPPPSQEEFERKSYENKYLEATKQLMLLAGETVEEGTWPKLEDTDFATIGLTASVRFPGQAGFLLATLNYTLTTLKYDYNWAWEQIEYRPEIV
jgi:hypothetical protein